MNISDELKHLLKKFEEKGFLVVHGLKHNVDYVDETKKGVIVWKRELESVLADNKVYYNKANVSGTVFLNPHIKENEELFFNVIEEDEDVSVRITYFDEVMNENLVAHHFTME